MANLLLKRIRDWAVSITSFRTGDVIAIDGPNGTAKMSKGDLLMETANNALAGNVSPVFDPNRPNDGGGYAYYAGTSVYHLGKNYVFVLNHKSGPWDASEVEQKPLSESIQLEGVGEAVNEWLNEHPEATTTVLDNSIDDNKLAPSIKYNRSNDGSAYGYKLLGVNTDIRLQMTDPNTIYEIRWTFDLAGETLQVPRNCVLKFNGGKISNGEIDFNSCTIVTDGGKIFDDVVPTDNSVFNQDVEFEWFGATGDGDTDDTLAVNSALAFTSKLFDAMSASYGANYSQLQATVRGPKSARYVISSQIVVDFPCSIVGNFTFVWKAPFGNDKSGAILFVNTRSFQRYEFFVWNEYVNYPDYSDGKIFAAVAFGDPDNACSMRYCNVSIKSRNFAAAILLYGNGSSRNNSNYSNTFEHCYACRCMYVFCIITLNGAWHNANRYIDITMLEFTGYTLPSGFTAQAVIKAFSDGEDWPSSSFMSQVYVESHRSENPQQGTPSIRNLLLSYECSTLTPTYKPSSFTVTKFRVENVGTTNLMESNVDVDFDSISFRDKLYSTADTVEVAGVVYDIYDPFVLIDTDYKLPAYTMDVEQAKVNESVINGYYAYRNDNRLQFVTRYGGQTLFAAFTPLERTKLTQTYGLPVYAFKIEPGTLFRIDLDRANSSYAGIAVFDSSGNQFTELNILDNIKFIGEFRVADDHGPTNNYGILLPQIKKAVNSIVIKNISNADIIVTPITPTKYKVYKSVDFTFATDNTSLVAFHGADADKPDISYVKDGFVYKVDSSSDVEYYKFKQSGSSVFWRPYDRQQKFYGSTTNRPSLDATSQIGTCYFDTTLHIPIWWNGSAWVKSDGTTV